MEQTQERTFTEGMPEEHGEERREPPRRFQIELLEARVAPVAIWGE
jgi:hypothetical protein